jgi:hypothetical protein
MDEVHEFNIPPDLYPKIFRKENVGVFKGVVGCMPGNKFLVQTLIGEMGLYKAIWWLVGRLSHGDDKKLMDTKVSVFRGLWREVIIDKCITCLNTCHLLNHLITNEFVDIAVIMLTTEGMQSCNIRGKLMFNAADRHSFVSLTLAMPDRINNMHVLNKTMFKTVFDKLSPIMTTTIAEVEKELACMGL